VLVLDTCTFIWLTSDPGRLSSDAAAALDAETELFVSDVSVWEICLKWQARKFELPSPPRIWVAEQLRAWSLEPVAIAQEHLYRAVELPELHRDPFDRLLVAQALALGAKLVTPDPAIQQYPVATLW
jgi:PIN domain nuclease of toxin-antitoxin system